MPLLVFLAYLKLRKNQKNQKVNRIRKRNQKNVVNTIQNRLMIRNVVQKHQSFKSLIYQLNNNKLNI